MREKTEKERKTGRTGKGSKASGYVRTDLAAECRVESGEGELPGLRYAERREGKNGEITVATLTVEKGEGERAIGKPAGEYVTVSFGRLWLADEEQQRLAEEVIADELRRMAERAAPGAGSVLVAGLGNRQLTVDAIGPDTVEGITVTRHLRESEPALFEALGQKCVSALSPGVLGQTGMESAALLESAVKEAGAGLVIAVDALAARSPDRLCATVQLTDAGICPGSGVGNARRAVSAETLGVPVISLGVPTVADSSTLVYDALEKAGIAPEEISDELRRVLENGKGFFVSVKESDIALRSLAGILAGALDRALER